ncbi:Chromo domain-containing protein [Mycena venus]|uniref:Chromo domain-containing protein n=1 Tax=Mycena venus TaxID=2733690 RepID=A0A8H6XEI5_9AGAR|nr:Chromo domain-containing protein [Mycena venus]
MGKKEKRKREPSVVPEEEPAEEEGFQVEVITHARVKDANLEDPWEYRVKWAGYASDEDSWEPAENVAACQRLLDSFWTEIGLDNEDYPEGYVAKASKEWIKKERKRFKAEFAKNKEEERKQKERAERRKEDALTKKAAKKKKQSVEKQKSTASVPSRSASTSSVPQRNSQSSVSSYPAPPPSTPALPPPKKKAKLFTSDPEDSEDDRPLSSLGKKRKLSAKAGDDKQTKVRKTQDKTSVSATSSTKVKNFESSKRKEVRPSFTSPIPNRESERRRVK